MTSLMFGQLSDGIPLDENVGRRTAVPVNQTKPAAEQPHAPERGEVLTDTDPNLGFVNRQLASDWHEGEQYAPFWQSDVNNQSEHNLIVDRQVSTSGTAAAREASGQYGHGTAKYAVGIETPLDLSEGGKMGNDYFMANDPRIQSTMGDEMTTPPGYDHDTTGAVMGAGKTASREASVSTAYQTWIDQMTGR